MCIVPTPESSTTPPTAPTGEAPCAAHLLSPHQRKDLVLEVFAGRPVSDLARQHNVSRKFVYSQVQLAHQALDQRFSHAPEHDPDVLFYLPVTRSWLRQFVLALVLICHCSLRGVHEILRDLFDFHLSVGSVRNIVCQAAADAADLNSQQDLTCVLLAAPDELFQSGDPVLAVVDVASTYCCLLSKEEHRDADTWGVRFLDLQRQGFAPRATIADGGSGLRAGQALALPGTPCWEDLFHAQRDLGVDVRFLENRAYRALAELGRHERPKRSRRQPPPPPEEAQRQLGEARQAADDAAMLADEVGLLARWLFQDVLAVGGPTAEVREELYDFIVAELERLQGQCRHRLVPAVKRLKGQKKGLLAFAVELDQDLEDLSAWLGAAPALVRQMWEVQQMAATSCERWRRDQRLHEELGGRYHEVSEALKALKKGVVRASSVVENVNSRLRNYFFLRREVGGDYLELLRFFLNHRRFLRSERPERVGKSPAELLTGQEHAHWLEMLGFQRFRRPA